MVLTARALINIFQKGIISFCEIYPQEVAFLFSMVYFLNFGIIAGKVYTKSFTAFDNRRHNGSTLFRIYNELNSLNFS